MRNQIAVTLLFLLLALPLSQAACQYVQPINVTNLNSSVAIPVGGAVSAYLNTQALVTAGKTLADGSDLHVFYRNASGNFEIDWVAGDFPATQTSYDGYYPTGTYSLNTTRSLIWFPAQSSIAASSLDYNYSVMYGCISQPTAPHNSTNIFPRVNGSLILIANTSYAAPGGGQRARMFYYDYGLKRFYLIRGTNQYEVWNASDFYNMTKLGSITMNNIGRNVWINPFNPNFTIVENGTGAGFTNYLVVINNTNPAAPVTTRVVANNPGRFLTDCDFETKENLMVCFDAHNSVNEKITFLNASNPANISTIITFDSNMNATSGLRVDPNYPGADRMIVTSTSAANPGIGMVSVWNASGFGGAITLNNTGNVSVAMPFGNIVLDQANKLAYITNGSALGLVSLIVINYSDPYAPYIVKIGASAAAYTNSPSDLVVDFNSQIAYWTEYNSNTRIHFFNASINSLAQVGLFTWNMGGSEYDARVSIGPEKMIMLAGASTSPYINLYSIKSDPQFASNTTFGAESFIDSIAPQWSNQLINNMGNGSLANFSVNWADNIQLSQYIVSYDGGSGIFVNDSPVSFTGQNNQSLFTKTLNSTIGANIRWRVWAFDNSSNGNVTATQSFITTDTTIPQWFDASANTTKNGQPVFFTATWINFDLANYTFEYDNGNGTLLNVSTQQFDGVLNYSTYTTTLPSTVGSVVRYRIYCWDDEGISNNTPLFSITVTDGDAPLYSNPTANTTVASAPINISVDWTDNIQLANYTFEFDSGDGVLVNVSTGTLTGTANTTTFITALNSTPGVLIRYRFYVWDNSSNMNATPVYSFNTVDETSPQYSSITPPDGASLTQFDNATFSVSWTENGGLNAFIVETNATTGGALSNYTYFFTGTANSSEFTFNASIVGNFSWRIYANDSAGNLNATPMFIITVIEPSVTAYKNINLGEGIGSTVLTVIKGSAQLVAGTINASLSPEQDLKGLLTALILLGILSSIVLLQGNNIKASLKQLRW